MVFLHSLTNTKSLNSDKNNKEESLRSIEYYPWIDVLRAICFFMVFFNHFGSYFNLWFFPWISRAGVSIFFVISGWLITKIIIKTIHRKDFLTYFYSRRMLRIYPAYYLTIFMYVLWFMFTGKHTFFSELSSFLTFNYSLLPGESDLFTHAWSISVEERFYVMWPLLCIAGKYLKIPLGLILTILLVFMTGSIFAIPQIADPSWAPFLPAPVIYGCLMALFGDIVKPHGKGFLQIVLVFIFLMAFFVTGKLVGSMYHPGVSLFALAIVWCCSTLVLPLPRIFFPIAKLGELSYGTYLIHMFPLYLMGIVISPISAQIKGMLWLPVFLIVFALIIILAYAMHRFIEKPVVNLRYSLKNRPRLSLIMAIVQVSLIPVGIAGWWLIKTLHPL